ncbi:MAG: molybdopterin converting factor subunit 1 [Betaproteobacteria bacterium]|nr:MAG: molybdopterin converting factor subunit 1 [Betaproteobacteria bacterium]
MNVTVRYFASIREVLGSGEQIEVPAETTLSRLRDQLIERSAKHAVVLARGRALRCALNQTLSDESAIVTEGAEVAFFPPVTGG